jgi:hypothetical protein
MLYRYPWTTFAAASNAASAWMAGGMQAWSAGWATTASKFCHNTWGKICINEWALLVAWRLEHWIETDGAKQTGHKKHLISRRFAGTPYTPEHNWGLVARPHFCLFFFLLVHLNVSSTNTY